MYRERIIVIASPAPFAIGHRIPGLGLEIIEEITREEYEAHRAESAKDANRKLGALDPETREWTPNRTAPLDAQPYYFYRAGIARPP